MKYRLTCLRLDLLTQPLGPLNCALGLNVDVQRTCNEIYFCVVPFHVKAYPFFVVIMNRFTLLLAKNSSEKNKTRTFCPKIYIFYI